MLKIKNLKLKVGERIIQTHEDYTFPSGSMTFVKGVSGSGKTTLLYILGLISKQNDYIYEFNGEIVNAKSKEDIRKNEIGMMYQNFNMLEELSLYDNLKLFSNINNWKMTRKKAKQLLHKFSLNLSLNRKFGTLSGGEKQRFCLACILAKKPQVIICDEPTSALDKENADQLMHELYKLCKEEGKTIIISTHSTEYDFMADNIIHLDYDHITQSQPPMHVTPLKKRKYRKLNSNFYMDMIKQRFKYSLRHSWFVILFTIIALSLSTFLLNYSQSSEDEYTKLLGESMQNEIFLLTDDPMNNQLSEENLDYIQKIPAIDSIREIKMAYASVTLPNGEVMDRVEVFAVAPFQQLFENGEAFVNSGLYQYRNETITLSSGSYQKDVKIISSYTSDRARLYSASPLNKVFVSEEDFEGLEIIPTHQYVVEINNFRQYDACVNKISLVAKDYHATSAYEYFSLLLDNLQHQQTFIKFTSITLIVVSFILFMMVQTNEVKNKKQEMCIFQANGLNKKHIFILELLEYCCKMVIFYIMSLILSYGYILVANHFILEQLSMSLNGIYLLTLLILLLVYIIIPSIVTVIYFLHQSPEDELRAII